MQRTFTNEMLDKRKHKSFIANLGKEGYATLYGTFDPVTQRWRWEVFIGGVVGEPEAILVCPICDETIITADRRCHVCKNFCVIELRRGKERLYNTPDAKPEVHSSLTREPCLPDPGIRVAMHIDPVEETPPPLKLDLPNFKPIGRVLCPHPHGMHGTYPAFVYLDKEHQCNTHKLKLSANLVWHEGFIYIERVAYDFVKKEYHEYAEEDRWIAKLCCPRCHHPIRHKGLRCVACKMIIVDVGFKQERQTSRSGMYLGYHLFVVYKIRTSWETKRPLNQNLLPMVGDGWAKSTASVSPVQADAETETAIDDILKKYEK